MDKAIFGVLGTLGALAAANPAHAVASVAVADDLLQARSYSELLEPIPNAVVVLQSYDNGQSVGPEAEAHLTWAQYHHHHHHHRHYRRHHHHYY